MVVADDIRTRYAATFTVVAEVADRVQDIVSAYCQECGYLFEGRIKTLPSAAEKIESGRFQRWSDLDDLYGCTVVVPLPSAEDDVLEFLSTEFEQIGVRRRSNVPKPPDVFRFDSTRFVGHLKASGLADASSLAQIPFEVQIKSVFDYAWSKAIHALVYKSQGNDWKQLRLAAQLKAITETLDALVLGFEQASEYVPEGGWPAVESKQALLQRVNGLIEEGLIPSEVCPSSRGRFVDNVYKVLMAFDGQDPTRMPDRPLKHLQEYLDIIEHAIRECGPAAFPRSISLFQFVLGALGSSLQSDATYTYYLPIPDHMHLLFGNLSLPCSPFSCDE